MWKAERSRNLQYMPERVGALSRISTTTKSVAWPGAHMRVTHVNILDDAHM